MQLQILEQRQQRHRRVVLPCNGCVECCKEDTIYIHPECGDDPRQYKTVKGRGGLMLQHKKNGDCIYLGNSGCTIHGRAPAVCREFDCRLLAGSAEWRHQFKRPKWRRLLKAAGRLSERMED